MKSAKHTISDYLERIRSIKEDEDYQAAKAGTSTVKLDPAELRAAADTLAGMPDFVGADVIAQLPKFRQMADLLESNLKSGRPFGDRSGNGKMLADLVDTEYIPSLHTLAAAMFKHDCSDY